MKTTRSSRFDLKRPLRWWQEAPLVRKLDAGAAAVSLAAAAIWPSAWSILGAALAALLVVLDPATWLRKWLLGRLTTRRGG